MSEAFAATLGYAFCDPALLRLALSHRSLNVAGKAPDNQRLEFFGDRVLGMIVAHLLYLRFPEENEGLLARRHALLVSRPVLAEIARESGLGDALILSPGEEKSGGRLLDSSLEDACEALIGALYLDGGLPAASGFIARHWTVRLDQETPTAKDAKSALQEWAQGQGMPLPVYDVLERSGPDHAPIFTLRVSVGDRQATAEGAPKRAAEQMAAAALLEQVKSQ